MPDLYVFNPFVFIVENEDHYLLKVGLEYEKELVKEKYDMFIKKILQKQLFSIEELLYYFSEKEIVELFTQRVFLEKEIDLNEEDSRNRGYFSLMYNETFYDQLKDKNILVLGAGAIGSHVSWMLAAMGMKKLTILDFDFVEQSNLNRQLLYEYDDVGASKVKMLSKHLKERFPKLSVRTIESRIDSEQELRRILDSSYDIVIRAIDSPIQIGRWVNNVCFDLSIPYISGGFIGFKGVVGPSYVPNVTPCLDCYEDEVRIDKIIHGTAGTLAPLTELVSSKIVYEVIKILSKRTINYNGIMEIIDPFDNSSVFSTLTRKRQCMSCFSVNEHEEISEDGKWQWVYFCGVTLIPFLGVMFRLPIVIMFIGILFLTAMLVWNTKLEKEIYEKALYGGVLFAVFNFLLTGVTSPETFNLTQPFVFLVANILMQFIATITLAVSIFEFISFVILKVRGLIVRGRRGIYERVS